MFRILLQQVYVHHQIDFRGLYMCIYYGDNSSLTYQKQEHIFPAGLGGVQMLPKGYVSDQANNLFSPLEGKLMHDSAISLMRAVYGPGKRGSLRPKKASKTKIVALQGKDGKVALGYLSGKHGYYINCAAISKSKEKFVFTIASNEHTAPEQAWENFRTAFSKFEGRYVLVSTTYLEPDELLLGFYEEKYYIALGVDCTFETVQKILPLIINAKNSGKSRKRNDQPRFDIPQEESDETGRIYAKVAINTLAALKGDAFVQHPRFDAVKAWILGQSDDDNYTQLPRITQENPLHFPEHSHWCLFGVYEGKLYAVVCFYDTVSRYFELADTISELDCTNGRNFGLICDWKNKVELTLDQWIQGMVQAMCKDDMD